MQEAEKKKSTDLVTALLLGWLVPGLGHLYVGRVAKGLLFFAILMATFFTGLWLADYRGVRWEDHPFYFVGQFGSGLTLLLMTFATSDAPRAIVRIEWFEPGLLYMCVASVLNLMCLIHLTPPTLKDPAETVPAASAAPPAGGTAS